MTLFMDSTSAPHAPYTAAERAWMTAGLLVLAVMVMLFAQHALAAANAGSGTGANILQDVYDLLKSAVTGTLGKTLILLIVVVGIAAGVMRQSLLAFAVGLGAGIGLFFAPTIIDALSTAVVMPAHMHTGAGLVLPALGS